MRGSRARTPPDRVGQHYGGSACLDLYSELGVGVVNDHRVHRPGMEIDDTDWRDAIAECARVAC
jgi:hypothetical protein